MTTASNSLLPEVLVDRVVLDFHTAVAEIDDIKAKRVDRALTNLVCRRGEAVDAWGEQNKFEKYERERERNENMIFQPVLARSYHWTEIFGEGVF